MKDLENIFKWINTERCLCWGSRAATSFLLQVNLGRVMDGQHSHVITQVALLSNNWKMLIATTEPPAVNRNVSLAIQQLKKRGKLSMHSGVKSNRTSSKATSLSNVPAHGSRVGTKQS